MLIQSPNGTLDHTTLNHGVAVCSALKFRGTGEITVMLSIVVAGGLQNIVQLGYKPSAGV